MRQDIVVLPSGESNVTDPGAKCAHGVYIPANSETYHSAHYCTVCESNYKAAVCN